MLGSSRNLYLVVVALTGIFLLSIWGGGDWESLDWVDVMLVGLNTLPLLLIGWNPVVVAVLFGVAYPLFLTAGNEGHVLQSLPTLVSMYAAGSWAHPVGIRAIALITPIWMMVAVMTGYWPTDVLEIWFVGIVLAVVWALGVVIADRQRNVAELELKTVQLEEARRELAELAVANERARIARELHDVVAHAMSLITVQAGVGAHVVESNPGQAGESLAVIERTGRQALSEMRRMLAVLTDPAEEIERGTPQPGTSDLPELFKNAEEAGLAVRSRIEGARRPIPAGLDLTIYRVVQEALTNMVKHSPRATATVAIRYDDDGIGLTVHSTGKVSTPIVPGQGLRGMAERVALYDGDFDVVGDEDGLRITAWFPEEDQ
ncbi:MAG: sensor histidine kinase [Acidimicrobiia bacterium]|nr:sensor histidine kinase [Acidimicrobiia bacterium]